ncbi:hypothetical protein [Serratia symbiotica]|uniref:hypothetical protein n=1 Tax=Serratia symbiotica TaxID=138074 RepID=UPI001329F4B2|nr:hypothetical protein [Serratia symbiotica]QTP13392.1 hypothetical protein GPZ83_0000190 [Serratia symbiotica]
MKFSPEHVIDVFFNHRFNFSDEIELQNAISAVLTQSGIAFEREHRLSMRDKPDFILDTDCGKIAMEVKIDGGKNPLLRQVNRYLSHDEIAGIIVVGTPYYIDLMPKTLNNKPIWSHRFLRSLLG